MQSNLRDLADEIFMILPSAIMSTLFIKQSTILLRVITSHVTDFLSV